MEPKQRPDPPASPGAPDREGVLPVKSWDETDVGWGGQPEPDDHERLLRERPPHWD